MILTHIVFHEFLSGIGGVQAEPEPEPEPVVVVEEATRPRPDDGGGRKKLGLKRRQIFKPTGLVDRPRSVEERVEQTAQIAREVVRGGSIDELEAPPQLQFSEAEVNAEIGRLLRKAMRSQEDELILLLLMAASAAC